MEIVVSDYQYIKDVEKDTECFQYLEPSPYVRNQSFYKKARVFKYKDGKEVLVSYDTPVVLWIPEMELMVKLQENDRYTCSSTTMRHIDSFLYWHNKKGMSVGEWRKITMI